MTGEASDDSAADVLRDRTAASRRGSVAAFLGATFALTWTCWLVVATRVPYTTLPGHALTLLGTFAPALIAFATTFRREGRGGVRALLRTVLPGPVGALGWALAAGGFAALELAVALLHRLVFGAWPRFAPASLALVPFAIALSTPVQAGEEFGWRGYALPRLEGRMGLRAAGLLLGGIWALWHLPLFFVRETDTFGQSFPVYALEVVAISVAMAWLWSRTGRALLPVMLLHAAINNTTILGPSALPGPPHVFTLEASRTAWLTLALLWACAAPCLVTMRSPNAARAGA